jgi:hypothetical protein
MTTGFNVDQILNDKETALRYALDGRQAQIWTAMPAIVTKVNLTAMTLECQPAIKGVQSNEDGSTTYVNLPVLLDVPICFPSAGGFTLTLPIAIGDEVLVIIANRCIDGWWQLGGIQVPIESRMHDLSDGFAIPGPRSQPRVVLNISATNAQLRNDAGTTYIEITPTGKINLVAPSGIGLTGPLTLTGALAVTGAITATGEVTAKSLTTPVALSTHIHSGVTTGSGDTGAPV